MFLDLTTQEILNIRQQSFSGTDLNTSTDKMGIVYSYEPNKHTDNQHTVSSIIDHSNNDLCLVKHTEARSVVCKSDKEVRYIKNRCIAVEYKESDRVFNTPSLIVETPNKLQDRLKSVIANYVILYKDFDTKMFVYEDNITSKYDTTKFNDIGYYEPVIPKSVLPANIVKDFKSNIRYYIEDEKKLEAIEIAINNQTLAQILFPLSKASTHKQTIVKAIKDKKYTTQEVFDQLSYLFLQEVMYY